MIQQEINTLKSNANISEQHNLSNNLNITKTKNESLNDIFLSLGDLLQIELKSEHVESIQGQSSQ